MLATLTSCEKFSLDDSSTNTHDGNANVIITVNKINNIEFEPITKSKQKELTEVYQKLTLAIFDGTEKVCLKNETSTDPDFGSAKFNLDEGEYRLVVIAHNGAGNCSISSPENVKFYKNKITDTSYYYGRLSVGKDKINQKVDLKRAVAKIEVHITDENIPEEVHTIQFYYTGGSSTLDATTGYGCVNSRQTESFKMNKDTRDYSVYSFPHQDTQDINMTISFLDPDGKTIKEVKSKELKIGQNKISYGEISIEKKATDSGFTFDNNWGEGIHVDFE